MKTTMELARRDLLKGLGVGLACLPALNYSRAWAAGEAPAKKLLIILASEGYRMYAWKPPVGPLGATLPQSCMPLVAHKDDLIFMTDMTNPNYKGGFNFGHEAYGSIFWGGEKTKGSNKYQEPVGSTFDQLIADGLPMTTVKSLHFQVQLDRQPAQKVPGGNRAFWRDGGAINPELNPQETYARLFAGVGAATGAGAGTTMTTAGDADAARRLMGQKKSILDYVGSSLERFKARVAKQDQAVIDGHLHSIRELEGQLSTMGAGPGAATGAACTKPTDPGAYTKDAILSTDAMWPKIMQAYLDMAVAGLSCGITNVATLQIADSTGNQINFGSFVEGIPPRGTGYKSAFRNWHDLGHNPTLGGVDHHRIVDEWCMTRFAELITKVKAIPGPTGTMLDNSVLLWANHMEDGATHFSQKVPWLLAGKAGGKLNTGQAANSAGKSIQGAMADICTAMGVQPADPFVGSIPGVLKA